MPTSPIIITGASSGMGKAAALQLAQLGHPLVLLLHDGQKGRDAHAEIVQRSGNRAVELEHADLASQADIGAAAARILERHKRLAGFIANAGAHFSERTLSPDGLEMTLAINHLAPFLLTNLLHDALKAHGAARIVLTASSLQFPFDFADYNRDRAYDGYRVYGQTKLANVQFTFAPARRLEGITVNCLAPGLVRTDIYRRTRGAPASSHTRYWRRSWPHPKKPAKNSSASPPILPRRKHAASISSITNRAAPSPPPMTKPPRNSSGR
ncbi:SDR family NAD(P)-dependent oxidoreductase [Devosia sp. A8/3-2]|nr:SDR family NAD(P)-dependent oxidoreductase [Devosia sp. A8/3-2]